MSYLIAIHFSRLFQFFLAAVFFMLMSVWQSAGAVSQRYSWAYEQYNDPAEKGVTKSRLTYGVSETDNAMFVGVCSARSSGNFSYLTFGSNVGNLRDGTNVTVNLSGEGFKHRLSGRVVGSRAEVGVTGVEVEVDNNDPLWAALQSLRSIDYNIPGFRGNTLHVGTSRKPILDFIGDCRFYAERFDEVSNNDQQQQMRVKEGISEKEAFSYAEKLNTIEAWEAFLNQFPEGFRSDIARAYVKKLSQESSPISPPPSSQVDNKLGMIDLGPGNSRWYNEYIMVDDGSKRAYSANVVSRGSKFTVYCGANKELIAIFGDHGGTGGYPEFERRLTSGLAKNPNIKIRFDNGNQYSVPGEFYEMTGEGGFSIPFNPTGEVFQNVMGANRMTLLAPPYSTTFQLIGSRDAMCKLYSKCGIRAKSCQSTASTPKVKTQPHREIRGPQDLLPRFEIFIGPKRESQRGCPRGTVKLEGQCVKHRDIRTFCGPGYVRNGDRCVHQNSIKQDRRCPPGMIWELGACTEND